MPPDGLHVNVDGYADVGSRWFLVELWWVDGGAAGTGDSPISRPLAFSRFRFMRLSGFLSHLTASVAVTLAMVHHLPPFFPPLPTFPATDFPHIYQRLAQQSPEQELRFPSILLKNAIQHDLHFRSRTPLTPSHLIRVGSLQNPKHHEQINQRVYHIV